MPDHRFAYLHGFASGPLSKKGQHLARAFEARGVSLELPDLNCPSFAELSQEAALAALDAMAEDGPDAPFRLVGSSFGGWLAARWAELHPARVDRLVLLCPGFELSTRWPVLVGEENMRRWQAEGALEMEDGAGVSAPVHWAFYEESLRQPGRPGVPCPTLVIHGRRDEVVPIETSRSYVAEHPHATLLELDDDHALVASLDRITDEIVRFFEL